MTLNSCRFSCSDYTIKIGQDFLDIRHKLKQRQAMDIKIFTKVVDPGVKKLKSGSDFREKNSDPTLRNTVPTYIPGKPDQDPVKHRTRIRIRPNNRILSHGVDFCK